MRIKIRQQVSGYMCEGLRKNLHVVNVEVRSLPNVKREKHLKSSFRLTRSVNISMTEMIRLQRFQLSKHLIQA